MPAKPDYDNYGKKPQVLAALTAIDHLLAMKGPVVPKSKMESFVQDGIKLFEIKAPPRGTQIFRLLAYREVDWNMFVAFAGVKRSQELPDAWKKSAAKRVKEALREGRPL